MNRYQKVIKYTKPLVEIDEKIRHLNERMTTTGFYTVTNQDGGLDEIPPVFNDAPLGDMDPDNFSWPDQGDGNPDNDPDMSSLLVTDTLGREIPRFDYLPGVNYSGWKREPDYSLYGGNKPLAIVFDGRALASTRYFYLSENGLNFVIQKGAYTTPGPYSDLQSEISEWIENGDKSGLTTKTIYLWGAIDCLFGSCYGGADYYPEGTTNTSDPKATRVLYPYTMYVPGTGNRNYASDPGVRARPPRVNSIISRDDLGDPNYYPGPATNVSPEAINYLLSRIPPYVGRPPRNSPGPGPQNVRGPSTPIKYYPGMGFGPAGPVQPGGFYANSYEPEGEVLSEDLTKNDFARLNKYVKDHPEELEYAFSRYPASDPRLSKLNWKMDEMTRASDEYVEKQFPENVEQTSRVKKILARNIELSDPKTFKDPKPALTYGKVFKPGNAKKYAKRNVVKKESNNLYTKALMHIDMNRVKELREEKIKREKIAEIVEQQQEIRAELEKINLEESKYVNWRRDLENLDIIDEGMTSSGVFQTTLFATGDNVNDQIIVSDISEFDPTSSGPFDNTVGVNEYVSYDYNIASGVFNGAITSQNGFTFNPPFTSPGNPGTSHRRTYGSYDQTTNKFTVTNDTISLQAIAGNSTNFRYGLGTNGGTKPLYDLDIYYLEFDDDGNLASAGDIGSIPKSTHTLTQFNFNIPPKLFGKQIQLYISSDDGSNAIHWWLGNSVAFHPTAISSDTNNWFHGILNQDILPAATGYPGIEKTSMANTIWSRMQQAYAGNSWDTMDSGVQGYPAPVSGGTRPLSAVDGNGDPDPNRMTSADLDYIVNYIETTFAQYHGMTTTMWGITNLQFKRQLPMSVFVGLDDPEAAAFVRDGNWDRLTPAEKKRLLEEQLAASSEYLDKMFGEGMPGTATEIADYEPQQSFSDIAQGLPYTDSDDAFDDPYYQGPPPDLDDDSDFDPDDFEYAGNQGPSTPVKYDKDMNQLVPNPGGGRPGKIRLKGKANMYAHHEPQGKVLSEKKRLKSPKDLVNKIPGYYDGKPSPLGFPVEEPPKMKNGFHPDLVDGKKVSDRFNRLDPESAKAMPPTGNPHIDKKVRAAAKKSK